MSPKESLKMLMSLLPPDINFADVFSDKNLNHYEQNAPSKTIFIFDDKWFFCQENVYSSEIARGKFKHETYDKTLYFIIDKK